MIDSKKIAIVGFGKEGVASANYLFKNNKVVVFEKMSEKEISKKYFNKLNSRNIDFYFNRSKPKKLDFDYIVRSPGVSIENELIQQLLESGAKLTSSTNIFFDDCPCEIIGVTGTKGKGTTSTLICELLKTENKEVFLAGNIGTPALEILPDLTNQSMVILELSSFQLIDLKKSPHVAVVLMITSEHLDWHKNAAEYRQSKEPIVNNQTNDDFAIINSDYEISRNFATKTQAKTYFFSTQEKANGMFLEEDNIISEIAGRQIVAKTTDILLPGKHNLQNVLAASSVAKIFGIKNESIKKVLKSFKGLAHRLQLVGNISSGMVKGVKFYNDSYSTIPETTIAAIDAIGTPKILILGGSSKNSDFKELAEKVVSDHSVKAVVLIGKEGKKIKEAIVKVNKNTPELIEGAKNMREIVETSYKLARPGDSIILSPACASFDMFANYEDRGLQFVREFKKLKTHGR